MTIQASIDAVQVAYDQVVQHPMCRAIRDEGTHYIVIYPDGDFPTHGLRCSYGLNKGQGKAWALERLAEQMEKDWLGSLPNPAL